MTDVKFLVLYGNTSNHLTEQNIIDIKYNYYC